jgi:hypothetical protein
VNSGELSTVRVNSGELSTVRVNSGGRGWRRRRRRKEADLVVLVAVLGGVAVVDRVANGLMIMC